MKITGELLKTQRLNLKLSIQDVSAALKLSSKTVIALEEGDLDKLPSKTFIRGFVKSYAQLLKLDVDAVLRQFQEEMGSTIPLPKVPPPKPGDEISEIRAARPEPKQTAQNYSVDNSSTLTSAFKDGDNQKKIALMISIAVLLIVVVLVTNKVVDTFNSNPVALATATTEGTAPAQGSSAEASNEQAPGPEPVTTSAAPASTDTTDKKQQLGATVPASSESTAAASKPAPATNLKTISELESGFEKSSGKPVEVMLEAKKDLELFYAKGDATQLTSLKMTTNQIQILRSKVGIYLKVSDGSAVKISVNGVTRGPAGPANKEVKLSF